MTGHPGLQRVLSTRDLIFYGIVLIQPIAPVGIFGLASAMSHGHAVVAVLVAMVAMALTAVSYGRMAALYPSAGSAFTYVGQSLGANLGFLAGWAMVLDYLIIPLINVVFGALTLERIAPAVAFPVWAAILVALMTGLNLRGIRATARANEVLLYIMCAVVGLFAVRAMGYLWQTGGAPALFAWEPFYRADTFDWRAVLGATSLAAVTYIGFDGVTTLAEEAHDARRSVLRATVAVVLIIGGLSVVQIYLAQRAWPDYGTFPNPETAFLDVSRRVGGETLFQAMGAILVIACLGSGLTGQAGAARLLYAMGRDGFLPGAWFARVDARRGVPWVNTLLIGALSLLGAFLIRYQLAAELLNFGAFLGFLGVNAAVIAEYGVRRRGSGGRRPVLDVLMPGLGFVFCLVIWLSLAKTAKLAGGIWLVVGFAYLTLLTRGFRVTPRRWDFSEAA